MTHGSLFSGIGGFDLAAQWMGWENIFHCENNEFCKKILNYYWPDAECFDDIKKTDFKKYANRIDVLSGGFPCQPYSLAGKRKGKEDDRHLWPEMLRAIREIRPRWVVGENVFGLVNWSGGLVFHEVQTDLEAAGYEVWPHVLPACAVNAPHRRDRVWFVAHRNSERGRQEHELCTGGNLSKKRVNKSGDATDTNCTTNKTRSYRKVLGQSDRQKTNGFINVECSNKWENFPTVSPICDGDDGLSDRLDSITFSKWRNESIKAYGNAVVPQIVFEIFRCVEIYESEVVKQKT